MRRTRRNGRKNRGGGAAPFPLKYYNTMAYEPSASAGHNLLHASGMGIRPKIGGSKTRRNRKGGFVPSVMDGFAASASQYVVPVALFAGYKLLTRKGKRGSRRQTRRRR
jgi:hypothetical protein